MLIDSIKNKHINIFKEKINITKGSNYYKCTVLIIKCKQNTKRQANVVLLTINYNPNISVCFNWSEADLERCTPPFFGKNLVDGIGNY